MKHGVKATMITAHLFSLGDLIRVKADADAFAGCLGVIEEQVKLNTYKVIFQLFTGGMLRMDLMGDVLDPESDEGNEAFIGSVANEVRLRRYRVKGMWLGSRVEYASCNKELAQERACELSLSSGEAYTIWDCDKVSIGEAHDGLWDPYLEDPDPIPSDQEVIKTITDQRDTLHDALLTIRELLEEEGINRDDILGDFPLLSTHRLPQIRLTVKQAAVIYKALEQDFDGVGK